MSDHVVLDTCTRALIEFTEVHRNLPDSGNGKFKAYTLTGPQVGAVSLLLWEAQQQIDELEALRSKLKTVQDGLDQSIQYLDPDGC